MKVHYQEEIRLTHEIMSRRRMLIRENKPRTPGHHLSAINQRLGIAAKKLSDSDAHDFPFERITDTHLPLMLALGIQWEEFRASHFQDDQLIWQPDELCRDGIYGTPDGLLCAGSPNIGLDSIEKSYLYYDTPRTWECKRTTKKLCDIRDHWLYLKQGLGYAAMGMPPFVQYDILYVDGNYNRPYQPVAVSSLVEFTEQEIEAWWSTVLKNKDNSKKEG